MPVTNRDVESAEVILLVGLDAEQEVPILHLRIRKAARRGAKVFVIHSRRTRLWDVGEHVLCSPGGEAEVLDDLMSAGTAFDGERPPPVETDSHHRLRSALREAGERTVVLAGTRLAESGALSEAAELAASVGGRFAFVSRRAGDRGALRAGVHPELLPGGRRVGDGAERAEVEATWGRVPSEPGRDTAAILESAARREIDVLYLVGVDPLRDFPDADLARRALENVAYKVVQDIADGPLIPYADAVLPAAPWHERDGHATDWEGRSQGVRAVRGPLGMARPDWQIFQELSEALDADMGFRSIESLQEEMATLGRVGGVSGEMDSAERFPRSPSASLGPDVRLGPPPRSPDQELKPILLFTYPLLVDEGALSDGADELKAALEEPAFVEVHPSDAARLDLADGGFVRVKTEAGEAVLPARVTPHVAEGSVFVPYNQPGLAANTLLSGSFVTVVTLEVAS